MLLLLRSFVIGGAGVLILRRTHYLSLLDDVAVYEQIKLDICETINLLGRESSAKNKNEVLLQASQESLRTFI